MHFHLFLCHLVFLGYFIAVRRLTKSSFVQFFEQLIKLALSILFLNILLPKNNNYACFALILGDLVSEIFSFFVNYLLFIHDTKIYRTNYITYSSNHKRILQIATPVALTSFLRSGLSTLKQLIIPLSFEKNLVSCQKSLSVYAEINAMALPIILFPNIIFSSVSNLFIPEFAAFRTQGRLDKIKKITAFILIISFLIAVILSLLIAVFSSKLANTIYHDLSISAYLKILSPIAIFVLLDCVIDNILKGLEAQNDVMIINILDLILTIFLIYFCVPKFGISGYIFAMYVSEIFNLTLSFYMLYKHLFNLKPHPKSS